MEARPGENVTYLLRQIFPLIDRVRYGPRITMVLHNRLCPWNTQTKSSRAQTKIYEPLGHLKDVKKKPNKLIAIPVQRCLDFRWRP